MATFTQKLKNRFQSLPIQSQNYAPTSSERIETTSPAATSEIGGLLVVRGRDLIPVHRLVVLIPNSNINEAEVARAIWKLAFPPGLAVLFLGLCPSINEEASVRRRLATIAALTRDQRVPVEIQLEFGRNWIRKLKTVLEAGDIVVCHAEQQSGIWRQPLELALAQSDIPILTLKGFISPMYKSPSTFLRESVFWLVSVSIIAGFFWIQMQALQISENWAKNILLCMSIFAELGILLLWHSLSS